MIEAQKPKHDVLIYPTNTLEFEMGVFCVEEADVMSELLTQHYHTHLKDGYRVIVLTDCCANTTKSMMRLSAIDHHFDEALVKFVNSGSRCAFVVDAQACAADPRGLAALLEKINRLCIAGPGIDVISVLVPKDWKDEFLATAPVAQALAESTADDEKHQAACAANTAVLPTPKASRVLSADFLNAPVTARVHLAGEAMKVLLHANPEDINDNMFKRAVEIADHMLFALNASFTEHGAAS